VLLIAAISELMPNLASAQVFRMPPAGEASDATKGIVATSSETEGVVKKPELAEILPYLPPPVPPLPPANPNATTAPPAIEATRKSIQ